MTTALYRRYRPQTFAEVIGQDHVTAPLRAALRSGQVNHAYLFSGPRGCGKTSSARILARILNCEQNTPEHPTDTPCGVCSSCVELATGGPGSLDVVEIDAASHGGVDDARELRERATFAPARDRYKVFIIDEAHMVSNQGFNALLKIVEEPPPHVRFVFATTEPDKVLPTIRSRTHHYPFRLVAPDVLVPYLQHVCDQEGVAVGAGVLPLVVRAGAGSVRDALSVLDQLIAGSVGGLDYEDAVGLLGYTPAALLDDLVDAISARDGATAFSVVERVIATGHEPRRFVEDLLERLRDLIVIAASGSAAEAALGALPADQLARMTAQATHLGRAELSRSADLANAALTEMVGATSPRLHLELLMARLLLPAADGSAGYGARLDRLERGAVVAPGPAPAAAPSAPAGRGAGLTQETDAAPLAADVAPEPDGPHGRTTSAVGAAPAPAPAADRPLQSPTADTAEHVAADSSVHQAADDAAHPAADRSPEPAAADRSAERPAVPVPSAPVASVQAPTAGSRAAGQDAEMLRRRWPEVLETVKGLRRATWILVGQNAQVHDLDESVLRLSFPTPGLVDRFRDHADVVARAVRETLGFDVHVQAVAAAPEPAAAGSGAGGTAATPNVGSAGSAPHGIPSAAQAAASWDSPASSSAPSPAPAPAPPEIDDDPGDAVPELPDDFPDDLPPDESLPTGAQDDDPSPDDPVIEGSNLVGPPLVARLLGGTVLEEQVDDPGR